MEYQPRKHLFASFSAGRLQRKLGALIIPIVFAMLTLCLSFRLGVAAAASFAELQPDWLVSYSLIGDSKLEASLAAALALFFCCRSAEYDVTSERNGIRLAAKAAHRDGTASICGVGVYLRNLYSVD